MSDTAPLRYVMPLLATAFQLLLPAAAFSDTKPNSGPTLPTLAVKTLFTLPPAADCGDNTYTPLWSGGGKAFIVWRDSTMHPMVTEVPEGGGEGTSVPLDPNPKYMAQYREIHHSYSLGLAKNGFIHITGDMNGYPGEKDKFQPARYRNKIILYWKSKSPYTVKDGFEFVGGDPACAIPGTKWSDGAFYADNNGELYYMSRVLAVGGAHTPPEMGIGLYRYDAANASWSALGAAPSPGYQDAKAGDCHAVLFWGLPASTEINREARGTIRFDKRNRIHFAAPAATSAATAGMNALVYACSEDGGKTWKKAGGAPIATLPMRAVPGSSQADLVASSNQNGILVESFASDDLSGAPLSALIAPQFASPAKAANSAQWSGEIAFPEAGTYTVEFHSKDPTATMSLINKRKGAQDPETGKLKDGNAQQIEVEKGMTLGFSTFWKKTQKSPTAVPPSLRWKKDALPMSEIPSQFLLPGGARFEPFAEVAADEKNTPAIACNPSNLFTGKWCFWEMGKKKWTGELPYPGDCQQENRILLGADGILTFESVIGVESYYVTPKVEFFRASAFDQEPAAYLLPGIFRICGTDEYTLRKSGIYRTILFNGKTQQWSVSQVEMPAKK